MERLRSEATTWVNAVALQAGRIDRRHRKRYLEPAEGEALEVDLHFFLVALVRLRRCVSRVGEHVSAMQPWLNRHLSSFDEAIPSLAKLRNVSEHIDEYNLDVGRDSAVSRRQVQNWYMDSTAGGGLIWGWLGERLDVEAANRAAITLYRGLSDECESWIRMQRNAELVSAAIVAWTGHGDHDRPQRDESLVVAQFGADRAVDLMRQVSGLEADFFSSTAHQTTADLVERTSQAAREFRERHPEVSDEALNALAWCYSYDSR